MNMENMNIVDQIKFLYSLTITGKIIWQRKEGNWCVFSTVLEGKTMTIKCHTLGYLLECEGISETIPDDLGMIVCEEIRSSIKEDIVPKGIEPITQAIQEYIQRTNSNREQPIPGIPELTQEILKGTPELDKVLNQLKESNNG